MNASNGRTIVLIGSLPSSLTNFRGDLIREFVSRGDHVIAMASGASVDEICEITSLGAVYRDFPLRRTSLNPFSDLKTLGALASAFRDIKPDVVLAYTIKPVIFSGLALRIVSNAQFYALITGLGYAFQGSSMARLAITKVAQQLYRSSLRKATAVIFQNTTDRMVFTQASIISDDKCHVVDGSGVNTEYFKIRELPKPPIRFLLIARMLGEKGIREFVKASELVRQKHPDTEFHIVGPTYPRADAITYDELSTWQAQGLIKYFGPAKDVREHISQCHVFVLPSYHEGLPRSVLEAMSMGRAIITTDVPGCRETVVEGENGFLVPHKDPEALANRMEWFVANADKIRRMGRASRKIVRSRFDVDLINTRMLEIMTVLTRAV